MDEPTGTQVPSMFLNFLGSEIDWGYTTEPEEMACLSEEGRKCYWPRGKVNESCFYFLPFNSVSLTCYIRNNIFFIRQWVTGI